MTRYTPQEARILLAFHAQHPDPHPVGCCERCYQQKPVQDLVQVVVSADEHDPADDIEISVCKSCL